MDSITRAQLITGIQNAKELLKRRARQYFKKFVLYTKEDYEMRWFHALICDKLDAFERGEIKKLAIFVPPQHGKSELTTRKFPAYLLGKNPKLKVGVISYNSTVAGNFNRSIQRNMDCPEYLELFPGTKLNESDYHNVRQKDKQRTTEQLDILGTDGFIKTIGWGGSLTSIPLDIGIIDDPIKDREEAQSEDMRAKLYDWYTDVFKTRLHNDSQQLIIQTRWHEHDLAGRILLDEKDWDIVKLPAIRTKDVIDYDPRQPGEALWPEKHSLARLKEVEATNPVTYNSLYQQNPQPNKDILIYNDTIQIPDFPRTIADVSWGLDFGKTTGINALVKGAVTAETTKSWVKQSGMMVEVDRHNAYLKEYLYSPNIPPSEIAKLLFANAYHEGEIVWCDHIPTKIRELQLLGITALPAVKGPGSVSSGIDKMHEYQIYYSGSNMKMEFDKYQYVTYDIIVTNVPVPNQADHLMDAMRYCLLSRFFREG